MLSSCDVDMILNLMKERLSMSMKCGNLLEPRNLGGAYKRFCNETSENLHGKEDVEVASRVYEKMLEVFALQGKSFEEISNLSSPDDKSQCFGKLLKIKQAIWFSILGANILERQLNKF